MEEKIKMGDYRQQYAEDMPYFPTAVQPLRSLGEVQAILEDFGVENIIVQTGKAQDGSTAWLVRFQYQQQIYRFVFRPKPCRNPDKVMTYAGKRRTNKEQAVYQMGRTAVWFVKAMMTAADVNPDALFAFAELPNGKTMASLGVVGVSEFAQLLPPAETIEGEVIDAG